MHYMADTDYDRLKPSNFYSYINFTLLCTIHYSASMEGRLLAILLTQLWWPSQCSYLWQNISKCLTKCGKSKVLCVTFSVKIYHNELSANESFLIIPCYPLGILLKYIQYRFNQETKKVFL